MIIAAEDGDEKKEPDNLTSGKAAPVIGAALPVEKTPVPA
jgi:hypothetical protein